MFIARVQRTFRLVVLVVAAGCAGGAAEQVMARETFVDVMVALRRAGAELPDTAAFDARRAEILASAGVTDSALYAFVASMTRDPTGMAAIWEAIDGRVNIPPDLEADTARIH